MISVKNLSHDYYKYRALQDIDVEFKKHAITALVGPNGAGKTTLIKCMVGLMKPTQGEIYIDDLNVYEHPREAHRKLAYLPDFFGLYDNLTVKQHLQYAAGCHAMDATLVDEAIQRTIDQISLGDKLNEKANALSRGMRQRLAIGQAIISRPDYLVLDEPASGLDPEARLSLSKLFLKLRDEGMSLIISSHILAELEEYATELVVIRDGVLFQEKTQTSFEKLEAENLLGLVISCLDDKAGLIASIKAYAPGINLQEERRGVRIWFSDDKDKQVALLKYLVEKGHRIFHFEAMEKRMQDRYFESIENN